MFLGVLLSLVERYVRDVALEVYITTYLFYHRGVAQLGRALRSGRRGRVFESRHPDFLCPILTLF